jgi:tRNA 2-thiouridine synthesizing protein A
MQEIDARGLSAPLPLLRAHRALRSLKPGQDVRVVTSYPQSVAEFQAMAKHVMSCELVSQEALGEEFVHVLRRRR